MKGGVWRIWLHCQPISSNFHLTFNPQNPLVVQSDKTVLLETQNVLYEDARDALARFAELEKGPECLHTYRITPLSLWNAAAEWHAAERARLTALGKFCSAHPALTFHNPRTFRKSLLTPS